MPKTLTWSLLTIVWLLIGAFVNLITVMASSTSKDLPFMVGEDRRKVMNGRLKRGLVFIPVWPLLVVFFVWNKLRPQE